jgi:hypothetical protein
MNLKLNYCGTVIKFDNFSTKMHNFKILFVKISLKSLYIVIIGNLTQDGNTKVKFILILENFQEGSLTGSGSKKNHILKLVCNENRGGPRSWQTFAIEH